MSEVPIAAPFYMWLGIVSLLGVAQFWSLAADLHSREAGERLFGVIAIGGSAGAIVGAQLRAAADRADRDLRPDDRWRRRCTRSRWWWSELIERDHRGPGAAAERHAPAAPRTAGRAVAGRCAIATCC